MNFRIVKTVCHFCHKVQFICLEYLADFKKFVSERFTAFNYLTPSEREALISGTCDNCWAALMGVDEADDDE